MIHIYEVLMLYEYQKYMIVLFKFWIKQIDKITRKAIYFIEVNQIDLFFIIQ